MKFVERNDRYTTYLDSTGKLVYFDNETAEQRWFIEEFDLLGYYHQCNDSHAFFGYSRMQKMVAEVTSVLLDPHRVTEIDWCNNCAHPGLTCKMERVAPYHDVICQSCLPLMPVCNLCDTRVRYINTVLGEEVCNECLGVHYSYCDECEDYHRQDERHRCRNNCDCESPAMHFSLRNDGQPYLVNDTRVTVQQPAGTISREGLGEIRYYLSSLSYGMADDEERDKMYATGTLVYDLDSRWQTKEGNFTKRLSRAAHKKFGLKLSPEAMSHVGNLASQHSRPVDFEIEITRDLNMSADDFYHSVSCWWQSHAYSRCSLKNNGGFGIRSFGPHYVTGRAWVMPLKYNEYDDELVPTFDTHKAVAFMVFNGYGQLEGYTAPRIVAHMTGMTYRKVNFSVDSTQMYVNEESYIVGPEELIKTFNDDSVIEFDLDTHAYLYQQENPSIQALATIEAVAALV